MKVWEKNHAILQRRMPEMAARLEAAEQTCCVQDGVIETPRGRYSPKGGPNGEAASRWAELVEIHEACAHAVSGFGTGAHVRAVLNRMDARSSLFVAEVDASALRAVLASEDFSDVLDDPRFLIGIGVLDDDYFTSLRKHPFFHITNAQPLLYGPCFSRDEAYYAKFFTEFVRNFELWYSLYKTNLDSSGSWQEQTLVNLPYLLDAPDVRELAPLIDGRPIVLIGAGPSLDDSVDFLAEIQDRAVLIAGNSAYQKLNKHGIKPHLTIAVDARLPTWWGYYGSSIDGVPLLAPFFVHPEVVRGFFRRTYTWGRQNPIISWLWKTLGREAPSDVLEKGTVSACILDLARQWGCTKVCLVGQDMALTASGQSHSMDSIYSVGGIPRGDLSKCRWLPGNTDEKVPVEHKYLVFLKTFQTFARENPQMSFLNTAEHGVKVEGMPYGTYAEAAEWLDVGSSTSGLREGILERSSRSMTQKKARKRLITSLLPLWSFTQRLLDISLTAAFTSESVPDAYDTANYAKHAKVQAALDWAPRINSFLNDHRNQWMVVFEGTAKGELAKYLRSKHEIKMRTEHMQTLRENQEYYWALAEGAHFLISRLQAVLGSPDVAKRTPEIEEVSSVR